MTRRLLIAASAALALILASSCQDAHAAEQGFYDYCAQGRSNCAARIAKIGAAGFRLYSVQIGQGSDPANYQALSDAAVAANVRIIWRLADTSDPATVVGQVGGLAGTWGYYLTDEPFPAEHAAVAATADELARLDPAHERMVVLCCDGGRSPLSDWADVNARIGIDHYPVFSQAPDPQAAYDDVRGHPGGGVEVLQAFRWGDGSQTEVANSEATRFPTWDEVQAMRDAAVDNGAKIILWWWLPQVIGWPSGQAHDTWLEPPDPGLRWNIIRGAAFSAPGSHPAPAPPAAPVEEPAPASSPAPSSPPADAPAPPSAPAPATATQAPAASAPVTAKAKRQSCRKRVRTKRGGYRVVRSRSRHCRALARRAHRR